MSEFSVEFEEGHTLVTSTAAVIVELEETILNEQGTLVAVVGTETHGVEQIEVSIGGPKGDPGPPGPRGPAGPAGTGTGTGQATETVVLNAIAGQVLSGHRVVVNDAGTLVYADPTNPVHSALVPLLTTAAAGAGDVIQVLAMGPLEESTWTWAPGQHLFVGANGVLTATAPTSGVWMRVVGSTTDATHIYFDPQPPIVLIN